MIYTETIAIVFNEILIKCFFLSGVKFWLWSWENVGATPHRDWGEIKIEINTLEFNPFGAAYLVTDLMGDAFLNKKLKKNIVVSLLSCKFFLYISDY